MVAVNRQNPRRTFRHCSRIAYNRTFDEFLRNEETAVVITNIRHAAKMRLYDSENRVCGYALTNSFGRGVNVTIAYDGSYLTNMVYALPNGSRFAVNLTRNASRGELITHRDYSLGTQSVYWYSTGYDLIGRPTNATDSVSLMREWLYNNRSELAAATIGMNQYGYEYDTIGNRLWSAANAVTNSCAANCLNQYTAVSAGANPVYDADGNMTGDGTFAYAYDAENRLVSVTSSAETNGALRVLNAYDHRNRRIRKIVQCLHSTSAPPPAPPTGTDEWQTLETHTFVWDGNNIVLEKVEFANGTTRTFEYFWGLDKSGTEQGAGGVGGLLAVSRNGQFYFPTYDNNGNVTKYIDESGNVVAAYEYDDFGRYISQTGSLADFFRHRFSTKYYDPETGLYYYDYRFYSPDWRIWLNRDPMDERGGMNLYSFCNNAQLFKIDADGYSIFNYLPFTSTLLSAIENYIGHIPGSSVTDYSFVSPRDCRCNIVEAEEKCKNKVKMESLQYAADVLSSAAIARAMDVGITVLTIRADPRVSAVFAGDGAIGFTINAGAYAKIMEGANKAKNENCSCSQYGY